MPDEPKKVDAVRVPIGCKGKGGYDLDLQLKADFASVLGSPRVDAGNHGSYYFVTSFPRNGRTEYFAKGHDREGQSRYTWEPQADGVEYGYLVDGATDAV